MIGALLMANNNIMTTKSITTTTTMKDITKLLTNNISNHNDEVAEIVPPSSSLASATHLTHQREAMEGQDYYNSTTTTTSSTVVPPSATTTPSFSQLQAWADEVYVPTQLDDKATPIKLAFMGYPTGFDMDLAARERSVVIYMVEQATGRRVTFPSWDLPIEQQWEESQVLVLNGFGDGGRERLNELCRKYRGSKLLIWTLVENAIVNDFFKPYGDMMVNDVQVSMGGLREPISDNYLRYAGWMGWALRPSEYGCHFPPEWEGEGPQQDEEEWSNRAKFAAIVSNHGGLPREEATNLLETLGFGQVDGLSHFHQNVASPQLPGEDLYQWKNRFLKVSRSFRGERECVRGQPCMRSKRGFYLRPPGGGQYM